MGRRVRRKVAVTRRVTKDADLPRNPENNDGDISSDENGFVDWTSLPDDTVIQLFTCLNYRDRASLSSTCRSWRLLGRSTCLWQSLDLRTHRFDTITAMLLSPRCVSLQKLHLRGAESADALVYLRARGLREVSGDFCMKITDATLSVIVARHQELESLELGPDFSEKISSGAIKSIAVCCPKLRKLCLSGIREIDGEAIDALAKYCQNLTDIGFIDCLNVDVKSLGNVVSVHFLSVAGTNIKWSSVSEHWHNLKNLKGLDVSRTDINRDAVSGLFLFSKSLKVMCALNCPALEEDASFVAHTSNNGKLLLTLTTDICKRVASLFADTRMKERNAFSEWRTSDKKDGSLNEIMNWLEWVLSHSLLRIAESNEQGWNNLWLSQGAALLLTLIQSSQEDVQERAATALAIFVVVNDGNGNIGTGLAEAVIRDGGVKLLLKLARCWREGIQSEAVKAIASLSSVDANAAKAVAKGGGISILVNLTRSMNRLVAEEAARGLCILSVGEEHKDAIAEAGAIKTLIDLTFNWSIGGGGVLKRAAGALANLAADDKCSVLIASLGGINVLIMLARTCKYEGVQEQAARALANLAAHGDKNDNNSVIGQDAGALEALVQFIRSPHDGVRLEAAGALWNLAFDDTNREAIAAAGGVEALVALANSCSDASSSLQERAAGAIWGLSVSESTSVAIGREGGIPPLLGLLQIEAEEVHETAAGAIWNLAYNPSNALRIVEFGGIPALTHVCSSSASKRARLMAALALTYMFDGRMDEYILLLKISVEEISRILNVDTARRMAMKYIEDFVHTFVDLQAFSAATASSTPAVLTQITESIGIQGAGLLRCSDAEIRRFVVMLRNSASALKACAAFSLAQFTLPGGQHAHQHADLLQNTGVVRALRATAAAAAAPIEAKIFAKITLRNIEHHQTKTSR